MPLQIGDITIQSVLDGRFKLDGGAMFGVVPKVLWERTNPADERNRITLALRCLLVICGDRRILVETGIGDLMGPKHRDIYGVSEENGRLARDLGRLGLGPEDITDVIISHLHFDHAGGAVAAEGQGGHRLAFPRASYHVQRRNWAWSSHPSERDAASFLRKNFAFLGCSGKLHLLDGASEICPGVQVLVSEGHTVGMQIVKICGGGKTAVFCADMIPTTSHLRIPYVMAYDLYPLTTMEEKKMLLAQAMEEGWLLVFGHDPASAACFVVEKDGNPAVGETIEL